MLTIQDHTESTIIIKKSKFICFLSRVIDSSQAQELISVRKKQYYDASHNCFAYVLGNGDMRYSDDGEPQGTAGLPMLDVIKRNELGDVLAVTTRFFGGTLLGAGGLVRAYSRSVATAIQTAQLIEIITCNVFETTFSYNTWSKAQTLLQDSGYSIDNTKFSDVVHVTLSVLPGSEPALTKLVSSVSLGKSTLTPLGKKKIERKI